MEKYRILAGPRGSTYLLYGVRIRSDVEMVDQVQVYAPSCDLQFSLIEGVPPGFDQGLVPMWRSHQVDADGEPAIIVSKGSGFRLLRITRQADFYITSTAVQCRVAQGSPSYLAPLYFIGNVMSLWLEEHGVLALHASAVACEHGAIAFMARSTGGKSTITASFVGRGFALVTDDILAVEHWDGYHLANPGYPQMRLSPSDAGRLIGPDAVMAPLYPGSPKYRVPIGGERSGWGSFQTRPLPLRAIYILDRREGEVAIDLLTPAEAMVELIRHSFAAEVIEAMGLQPNRFDSLGRLAAEIPIRLLHYPTGFDRLDEVREKILEDSLSALAR